MIRIILVLLMLSSVSVADHDGILWSPQGLPVDNERGPWFATIDTDSTPWAWNRQTDVVRKGQSALRFEVRAGDCFTAKPHNPQSGWDDCTRDRERSEIREKWYPPLNQPVWYEWSMLIPSDYEYIYPKQIFFQWHGGDGGPVAYFQLDRNEFRVNIHTIPHETTSLYKLGSLPKNQWIDFTVRAVWSDKEDGMLILWINDQLALEHIGATMFPDAGKVNGLGPYAKMGIYRSHLFRWKENRPLPTHVLYFDEYRRGLNRNEVEIDNHSGD